MKTKKTIAGIINILLAAIMVLSLASCGDKASAFSKKIDAMEAAAKSGNRADFEKAAEEAVIFSSEKLKIRMFFLNEDLEEKDKDGKITQLIDRMFEIGLSAPAQNEENFEFKLSDDGNGVIITDYKPIQDAWNKDNGKRFIVIPSEIQGLPVIKVYFKNPPLEINTISVPGSVKVCGGLGNCYYLKLSEGVEQVYGFSSVNSFDKYNGKIRKIDLPSSLKRIGASAFEGQINLESINLGSNIVSIGDSAFKACIKLKEITLPDSLITIDNFAFYRSGLEKVTLPSSLKVIGCEAFAKTKIENITFPDSVKWLGTGVFKDCENLKSLSLPSSIKYIFYDTDTLLYNTQIVSDCDNLEKIELAEGFNPIITYFEKAVHSGQEKHWETRDYTDMFKGKKIDTNLSIQKTLKSHAPFEQLTCGTISPLGKEYWGLKNIGRE